MLLRVQPRLRLAEVHAARRAQPLAAAALAATGASAAMPARNADQPSAAPAAAAVQRPLQPEYVPLVRDLVISRDVFHAVAAATTT